MSEGNKKSGGSYKPQSAVTIGRNKRLKGERHAKRMAAQAQKFVTFGSSGETVPLYTVPRGTKRMARRAHLSVMYAKRQAALAA